MSDSAHGIQVPPMDEYNRKLVSFVHPPDRPNPEPADKYNLVVIGAGTAGLVTAAAAASLGGKAALVERHLMGGDCLNVGCVPSKALIRSARAAADVRDASRFGMTAHGHGADFPTIMQRLRRVRAEIAHNDSVKRFEDLGVEIFLGQARFLDGDTVELDDGTRLRFKRAVIATGARAAELPIPGLREAGYLNNETVFSLTKLPRRLAVIGAGPIGVELAQSFQRFGSEVTLVEIADQILIREDPDAASIVEKALQRDGVELAVGVKTSKITVDGEAKTLHLEGLSGTRRLTVDEILLGVGRTPNVNGLNLEAVGVKYDKRKGVEVNSRLQTSNPRIYAAGDICSRYQFTHTADAMARIVVQNALFLGRKRVEDLIIPWVTYTDPEIAHVGLYEKDAREKGIEVDTYLQRMDDVDRAVVEGEREGLVKIHVEKGKDKILGATIVARHAGEMISEVTLAMNARMGLGKISSVIHPYPTQAEAIRKLGDAYNRTRVTPLIKKWMKRWLKWTL